MTKIENILTHWSVAQADSINENEMEVEILVGLSLTILRMPKCAILLKVKKYGTGNLSNQKKKGVQLVISQGPSHRSAQLLHGRWSYVYNLTFC